MSLLSEVIETDQAVETVRVSAKCPDCEYGELESCNGVVMTSSPPWYLHKCNKCGVYHHVQGKSYPLIRYTFIV